MKAKPKNPVYEDWHLKAFTEADEQNLKRAEHLWSEYQYRHDLIWSLLFRLTTAIVILSAIPYTQTSVTKALNSWILIAPALGILLACVGFAKIKSELRLLGHIRNLYRPLQDHLFVSFHTNKKSSFSKYVLSYFGVLTALTLINLVLVAVVWIPHATATI